MCDVMLTEQIQIESTATDLEANRYLEEKIVVALTAYNDEESIADAVREFKSQETSSKLLSSITTVVI